MTICATALLADNYSGAELKKKIGLQSACMGFGAVVLEIAGGALADISWHAPFYIYLIALLIIPGAFVSIKDMKKRSVLEIKKDTSTCMPIFPENRKRSRLKVLLLSMSLHSRSWYSFSQYRQNFRSYWMRKALLLHL